MRFEDWGLIDYEASVRRQLTLVDEVASGRASECIVMCTHPPVVTLGRGAVPGDLDGWQGPLIETTRGGRATYHGPSQIVVYPILDLRTSRAGLPPRDVHGYLRQLETATVRALAELGLAGVEARETKLGELSLTGVWIGSRKIASIGIAVRKWITYHGVAVNVFDDPAAFAGIRPCGFAREIMTNAERELGEPLNDESCRRAFTSAFSKF